MRLLYRQGRGIGEQTEDRWAMREDTCRSGSQNRDLLQPGGAAVVPEGV